MYVSIHLCEKKLRANKAENNKTACFTEINETGRWMEDKTGIEVKVVEGDTSLNK